MTVCDRILMLSVLPLFLFLPGDMTSEIRRKRVLHGLPTKSGDRDQYYPHFRYFVFLAKEAYFGQINGDPNWFERWAKIFLTPTKEMLRCGGSLLTPSIVQTACHCLATYTKQKGDFIIGTPLNAWEDRIFTFVGSNVIDELYYALDPKHYIIHEACRKTIKRKTNFYDFAVIVNKDSIYEKAKEAKISYAPMYRAVDLRNFYYTAIEKQYTCLLIGFGKWNTRGPPIDGNIQIDDSPSKVIRWGWRSLKRYKECMVVSGPKDKSPNYSLDAPWTCLSSTTKDGWHYTSLAGDSGGPVTCNNVYFAMISTGTFIDSNKICETLAAPIVLTPFENAVEHRDDFIKFCNEFGSDNYVRPTRPPNPYKPTPPPTPSPRRSQSPAKIILHRFMIPSYTLFAWLSYHYSFPL